MTADLELERYGFRFATSSVVLAVTTYRDGTNCLICQDPGRTAENSAWHSSVHDLGVQAAGLTEPAHRHRSIAWRIGPGAAANGHELTARSAEPARRYMACAALPMLPSGWCGTAGGGVGYHSSGSGYSKLSGKW